MNKLLAFHNDQKLKDDIVAEIKWHQDQYKIIQGTYGDKRGYCAVGCAIHSLNTKRKKDYDFGDHSVYETEFGIPKAIAHLEDKIFEGLTEEDSKEFPLRFMSAVPVGADLSLVTAKFMVWLLADKKDGVIRFAREDGKLAIKEVVRLYKRVIAGKTVSDSEWDKAARAAHYAADAAHYAAARAAANPANPADLADLAHAAHAARAAADLADLANLADLADPANAARAATDATDATYAAYKKMADKLIELISEAPVQDK